MSPRIAMCIFFASLIVSSTAFGGNGVNWEEEPIRYSEKTPSRNSIARLQAKIDSGAVRLEHEGEQGYLRALLRELAIPVESQVLVFSKTSLQNDKIGPDRPRALYFNSTTHLGYVRGGVFEIAVADPDFGMAFYTMDPDEVETPKVVRQANRCMACHGAARTKSVPGLLVRSVFPDLRGEPVVAAGGFLVNHKTPVHQRWGGWYVTGTHGAQHHLGNMTLSENKKPKLIDNATGENVLNLDSRTDTSHYLRPDSDIAALMVLEHQVEAYNLLTIANFTSQRNRWEAAEAKRLGEVNESLQESNNRRLRQSVQAFVDYLIMKDEHRLSEPIAGKGDFIAKFNDAAGSAADKRIEKLDLNSKLFAFSCSHLVYSPILDELDDSLKKQIGSQLLASLKASADSNSAEHREAMDRLIANPPKWLELTLSQLD